MQSHIISASILSADFANLGEECSSVIDSGADWIHFDVMDNHYVPNLTFGAPICKALKTYGIKAPIDVHLMVEPVDSIIEQFIKAEADIITFHPEASKHLRRSLQLIKSAGIKAGIALNPATPLTILDYVLDELDLVLVMTVDPGFGGQKFITSQLNKIKQLRTLIDTNILTDRVRISVDGGIYTNNISSVREAGANTFVAGSAIFNSDNYKQTISSMRENILNISTH